MTKLGTAYIEVQPDFSSFDRSVTRHLAGQFRDVGNQAGSDFSREFNKNSSGLLLPFTRALGDTSRASDKLTAGLKDNTTAAKTLGREGEKAVNAVRDGIGDLGNVPVPKLEVPPVDLSRSGRVDLQIAGADARLQQLHAHIDELTSRPQTLEVRVAIAKALIDLDRVEAKKHELESSKAEVKVDVDRSLFAQVTAGAQELLAALGGAGGGGLGGATARISAGFFSFGAAAGPLAAILGGLAVTIGVAVVGALAALAASLAAAAAGVGVLAAAFVGVLGPGVAVAAAVVARLVAVFGALKAQDAAGLQAGQSAAAGAQAAAAASDQQASAARALTDANRQLGVATSNAYREMQDSADAAADAIRGIQNAQESLASAKLSVREARNELAQFRQEAGASGQAFGDVFKKFTDVAVDTSGLQKALAGANQAAGGPLDQDQELHLERLILNVRDAKLREKDAVDGVSDAQRAANRAQQTHNQFVRQGIRASQGYQAALRGVRDAQAQVTKANRDTALPAAQAKAITLVSRLSKQERELLKTIRNVRDELRGAFSQATNAVLGAMTRSLERLPRLLNPLRGNFGRLGTAISEALDIFSRELIDPRWISALRQFTNAGARISLVFTRELLVPFLRIVRDLALQALPVLESALHDAGAALHTLSDNTGPTRLHQVVTSVVGQLRSWLALAGQLSRVFLAFLTGGAGEGKKLVDTLTNGTRHLADFLNSAQGQNTIQRFFADVLPLAKEFLRFIGLIVIGLAKFGQTVAPALAKVLGLFNNLLSTVGKLFFSLGTGAATSTIDAQTSAADRLRSATRTLADAQITAAQNQRDLTNARRDARRELSDLAATAKNADLNTRQARFDLKDARTQLAALKARGASADKLARAQLAVDVAQQRVRDSAREATRAHQENTAAQKRGAEANPAVKAAKQRINDQNKSVDQARKQAAAARKQLGAPAGLPVPSAATPTAGGVLGQQLSGQVASGIEIALGRVNGRKLLSGLLRVVGQAIDALFSPSFWIDNFAAIFSTITLVFPIGRILKIPGAKFLFDHISKPFFGVVGRLGGFLFNTFKTVGGRAVGGLISELVDLAPRAAGTLAHFLIRAGNTLGRLPGRFRQLAGDAVTAVVDKLGDLAGLAGHALGKGIGLLVTAGKKLGGAIVDGITSAIKSAGSFIVDAVKSVIPKPLRKAIGKVGGAVGAIFRNRGGIVPGTGFSDTVPAMLTPMEYVVRQQIVRAFGPTVFADINAGRLDPTVGYPGGAAPAPRMVRASGPRFGTGGLAGAAASIRERPQVQASFPINVVGGGPPDPIDLGAKASRVIEDRFGGDVRQN